MAKKPEQQSEKVKVIRVYPSPGGAFGFSICEVNESDLKVLESPEPDIFAIFISQLTKACRELLGI